MIATSMAQLQQQIRDRASQAMGLVRTLSFFDMRIAVTKFYTGGTPVMYSRTGALGNTPTTSPLSGAGGDTISFEAYLDTGHQYTSGARPSMLQVLKLANDGIPFMTSSGRPAKPTVGKRGFWEDAKDKIEKDLYNTMGKFFK